jgi:hypothetical protein
MTEIAEILTSAAAGFIVSAVLVLTQLAKSYIGERYIPLFGFLVGVILSFVLFGLTLNTIIPAILISGSALGLYDVTKKSILGK